ncbi:hypothetical protein [Microbispora sp. H10949]|uniref:hypothetical protein n=1 Tax=Microbispora sp. H10949 TaxID=2729111 RepID=UPI001602E9D4|nr:hypothetical protein [Microbispora sp. H10949]
MALDAELIDGRWHLRGVTPTSGPVLLGRWHFRVGDHWVGFDDDFSEPFVMRAFFDPPAGTTRREGYGHVGYIQFMRMTHHGRPIPPQVFGGRLADREPYAREKDNYRFVDIMGPKDLKASGLSSPFYAFNAWLSDPSLGNVPASYAVHPLPNGSLYVPGAPDPRASTCASIVAPVTPGLLTRGRITKVLEGRDPARVVEVDRADVRGREPYRIALDELTGGGGPLAGLDERGLSARAIGEYVLLALPDDEDLGETLVVRGEQWRGTGTRVSVHVLSAYEMRDLEGCLGRAAMRRISDHLASHQWDRIRAATGRGTNGLLRDSFDVTSGDSGPFDPADVDDVTFVYTTIVYGVFPHQQTLSRQHRAISGIVWRAGYRWDEDTGRLSLTTVVAPEPATVGQKDVLLFNVRNASTKATAAAVVDPYEFTTATMRRQPFGGGDPVAFVTPNGEAITP